MSHIPGRKVPDGYRCVTWPTGEERLTKYRRPEEAIIGPACDHLLKMQERCLEATLVCAYVRPDAVDDLEAHGAFRNNKALHDKCVAMRTILLQHEARFRVNLRDAEAADPIFAQKLRDSGVNNSPSQMSQNFKRTAGLKVDNTPLPQPPAPAGHPVRRWPSRERPRAVLEDCAGNRRRDSCRCRRRSGRRECGVPLDPRPAQRPLA
ncbi:hypothetical protein [Nannocystis pusilla]|uniref:hypothetical protein n=1 Tax=Nannocystis pusilla TaxID=889268 RepID=UPI003B7B9FF2